MTLHAVPEQQRQTIRFVVSITPTRRLHRCEACVADLAAAIANAVEAVDDEYDVDVERMHG